MINKEETAGDTFIIFSFCKTEMTSKRRLEDQAMRLYSLRNPCFGLARRKKLEDHSPCYTIEKKTYYSQQY